MGKWSQVREAVQTTPGGLRHRLRTWFFTGLILVLPAVLTLYILWLFLRLVVGPLAPLLTYALSPVVSPGLAPILATILSVLVTAVGVTAVGGMVALFGRRLFLRLEGTFSRLPVIRAIYGPIRQLLDLFLRADRRTQTVALAPYPQAGSYAVVFLTDRRGWRLTGPAGAGEDELVGVFLPTTPNPTTGFFLLVPRRDLIPLDLSVEEAMKIVVSGGVLGPAGRILRRPGGAPEAAPVVEPGDTPESSRAGEGG
ncbi:MAG TPA: DUF502 domain-containing protein [Candidatus Methylomirabilis sp.]|jgi:uncharacterized membrane protein|nr:DUF502 domain-containing protein [Candidatus Methylomirabilis sp.]